MNLKDVKIKEIFRKLLSQKNFSKYALVLGFSGIFLIFISGFLPKKHGAFEEKATSKIISEQKREQLEKNLELIISKIKGAGNSKVLITLESGAETVYATEEKNNSEASEDKSTAGEVTRKKQTNDSEKRLITVKDSAGTEHALAVTEIEPKIKGVVVICPGGDDAVVKKRIVEATTTALSISSSRVCVTKSG